MALFGGHLGRHLEYLKLLNGESSTSPQISLYTSRWSIISREKNYIEQLEVTPSRCRTIISCGIMQFSLQISLPCCQSLCLFLSDHFLHLWMISLLNMLLPLCDHNWTGPDSYLWELIGCWWHQGTLPLWLRGEQCIQHAGVVCEATDCCPFLWLSEITWGG